MDPAVTGVYSVRWRKPGSDDDSDWILVVLLAAAGLGVLWWIRESRKSPPSNPVRPGV